MSKRSESNGRWRARTSDLVLVREKAPTSNHQHNQALTGGDKAACTSACTSKPENEHESKPEGPAGIAADALPKDLPPDVADLARRLAALPEAVRASLLAAVKTAQPQR